MPFKVPFRVTFKGYVKVRYPKGMQFDRLSKDCRPSLDATLKGLPEGLPKAP